MMQFKPLPAIMYACFSRELYRDVLLRWNGVGLNYLFLLNVLLITPAIIALALMVQSSVLTDDGQLQPELAQMVQEVSSQLPLLVFENGELSTDAQQPYVVFITTKEGRVPFGIIDLDAGLKDLQLSDAAVLLTREAVHTRIGPNKYDSYLWSEAPPERFELDARRAQFLAQECVDWAVANKNWMLMLFGVLAWVGTLLVMMIYRGVQAFVFGGAALMIAAYYKFNLRYADAVRLSAVAITPPILADAALHLLVDDMMGLPIFVLITLGYLVFAVRAIALEDE